MVEPEDGDSWSFCEVVGQLMASRAWTEGLIDRDRVVPLILWRVVSTYRAHRDEATRRDAEAALRERLAGTPTPAPAELADVDDQAERIQVSAAVLDELLTGTDRPDHRHGPRTAAGVTAPRDAARHPVDPDRARGPQKVLVGRQRRMACVVSGPMMLPMIEPASTSPG